MRRNQEFLLSLGIGAVKPAMPASRAGPGKAYPGGAGSKKRKVSEGATDLPLPTRRSTRVAGGASVDNQRARSVYAELEEDDEEEEEEVGSYDDSSVLRYVMTSARTASSAIISATTTATDIDTDTATIIATTDTSGTSDNYGVRDVAVLTSSIRSLALCSDLPMLSETLAAVYSLQFHPTAPLLMAAGKGGYVSLFRMGSPPPSPCSCRGSSGSSGSSGSDDDDAELLTFKAHDSWVAAAKFIAPSSPDTTPSPPTSTSSSASRPWNSPQLSQQMLCITASNDGSVKLWDVGKTRALTGRLVAPQLLAQNRSIHAKGVFSLDVYTPSGWVGEGSVGEGAGGERSGGEGCGVSSGGGYGGYLEGVRVLTGSKDRQVCVSRLRPDGGSNVRGGGSSSSSGSTGSSSSSGANAMYKGSGSGSGSVGVSIVVDCTYDALHTGVVKSVCWSTEPGGWVFASGGQDRRVCVKDTRGSTTAPDVWLEDVHGGGVHTVVWGPSDAPHLLLTAGADPFIKLFDVRWPGRPVATMVGASTSSPTCPSSFPTASATDPGSDAPATATATATLLHSFRGHSAPHVRKHSTILPPRFLGPHVVVAAGEGSDCLSLYCARTGATLSRGVMPDQPIAIAVSGADRGRKVSGDDRGMCGDAMVAISCRRGGAVYTLRPVL